MGHFHETSNCHWLHYQAMQFLRSVPTSALTLCGGLGEKRRRKKGNNGAVPSKTFDNAAVVVKGISSVLCIASLEAKVMPK